MTPRTSKRVLAVLCAALVVAAIVIFFTTRDPSPPAVTPPTATPTNDHPALAVTGAEQREPHATTPPRENAFGDDTTDVLRVRLRGLHPNAPWTAALHFEIHARDEANDRYVEHTADARVDDEGRARFVLPTWWRAAKPFRVEVSASDERYSALFRRLPTTIDPTVEFDVDVSAFAIVTGRVIDAAAAPVPHARIRVFAVHGVTPIDRQIAHCDCDADGTFRTFVPFDVPSLFVALDVEGGPRLAAHTRATTTSGEPTRIPDLVLTDGTRIEGIVQWSDGAPVRGATIEIGEERDALHVDSDWERERSGTPWLFGSDGRAHRQRVHTTDSTFSIALPDTGVNELTLTRIDGLRLSGTQRRTAVAGQVTVFTLPRPIGLRATRDGTERQEARIEFSDRRPGESVGDAGGRNLVLLAPSLAVRATENATCSSWTELTAADAGEVITLELAAARTEVTVDLGEPKSRFVVHVECTDERGRHSRQWWRASDRTPFRLFLDPGVWNVSMRVLRAGEANTGWAAQPLRVERTVEVGTAPMRIAVALELGGTFTVTATDRAGRFAEGTCRVVDARGVDRSATFSVLRISDRPNVSATAIWHRDVGELVPRGTNEFDDVLRTGTYDLLFDFAGYGARRERISIREGEVTDVRIVL